MKRAFLTIVAVVALTSISLAYAGALDYFSARPDGDGISVEWKSASESGIKSYTLERTDSRTNDFTEITTVPATGNGSYYKYRDGHVNAIGLAGQAHGSTIAGTDAFRYRLRMNLSSEISYSQTITVTKPASGVRRTWGMIKEMFH